MQTCEEAYDECKKEGSFRELEEVNIETIRNKLKNAMEIKFNTKISGVDKNSHLTMQGNKLNTLEITFKDDNSELVMENPLAHDKPKLMLSYSFVSVGSC